jgi:hypothetical protein
MPVIITYTVFMKGYKKSYKCNLKFKSHLPIFSFKQLSPLKSFSLWTSPFILATYSNATLFR